MFVRISRIRHDFYFILKNSYGEFFGGIQGAYIMAEIKNHFNSLTVKLF